MKINDVLKEDLDDLRGTLYKYTGLGGGSGNLAATRTKFISDFAQQFNMAQKSAKKGGVAFSVPNYIQAYLRRYNWYATPEQIADLEKITNPTQLANAVYAVGIQQSRDKNGNVDATDGARPANIPANSAAPAAQGNPEDQTIEPSAQPIIKTLKTMKGPKYERELEQIIKLAMWNLYGTDKQDYNELIKSIMNKKAAAPAAGAFGQMANQLSKSGQPEENPNIVRGSNE